MQCLYDGDVLPAPSGAARGFRDADWPICGASAAALQPSEFVDASIST